jgi:flagellar biosynthesis/type III secretory pathway protein FliH
MIPNSQENMGSVDLFELKIMLASTENPELIKKILKLIKKISERKDEEQLKKSIDIFAEGIQVKQIGQPLKPKPETSKRKTKVRVAVPQGSKGKIKDGKSSASEMVLPPGKIKFTGVGDDGRLEAEVVEQMSASDYMKKVEETSRIVQKKSKDKKVSLFAKTRADKAKKTRNEIMLSSSTPESQSDIAKITSEKSESIIENAKEIGMNIFTPSSMRYGDEQITLKRYYEKYENNLFESLEKLKIDNRVRLFDEVNEKVRKLISSSSEKQLRLAVKNVAVLIHQDIDRRVRVSMSKSSLENFIESGKILNIDVDSESLKILKNKRDSMLGNNRGIKKFSLTPVELMHGTFVEKTEEILYASGTRTGSEEFADTDRGIEVVLRAQNSPRIGYGKKESYDNGGVFAFINEEDQRIIELAVFGGDGNFDESTLLEILEAYVTRDMSSILRKNDEDTFEAFIVGEVSLNDIEHIKIPLSIFSLRKRRVAPSNPIGGKQILTLSMRGRKLSENKIAEFFEKDGTIGGGYSPKYLSYLLEYEASSELKEKLISLGIQDVVFTNREGIDIMGEKTWSTPKPNQKFGIEALREIAKREVESILDKHAPKPVQKKLPPSKKEEK